MHLNERKYRVSDALFLQHAETVVEFLPTDIQQFINFDSTFSVEYPGLIIGKISEVKAIKADQVVIDELAVRLFRTSLVPMIIET